eukprot:412522-Amorphochlora_amoeboformis.AAC.1
MLTTLLVLVAEPYPVPPLFCPIFPCICPLPSNPCPYRPNPMLFVFFLARKPQVLTALVPEVKFAYYTGSNEGIRKEGMYEMDRSSSGRVRRGSKGIDRGHSITVTHLRVDSLRYLAGDTKAVSLNFTPSSALTPAANHSGAEAPPWYRGLRLRGGSNSKVAEGSLGEGYEYGEVDRREQLK